MSLPITGRLTRQFRGKEGDYSAEDFFFLFVLSSLAIRMAVAQPQTLSAAGSGPAKACEMHLSQQDPRNFSAGDTCYSLSNG